MARSALLQSSIPGFPVRRGKVRDVYDLGDRLLFVATDRISAFDWVLPTGIPDKGRVLTQLSAFWFDRLGEPNHLLTTDVGEMDLPAGVDREQLEGRTHARAQDRGRADRMRRARLPVRLGLEGVSQDRGTVCGIALPAGLRESERLPEPIFTPATKAESGHDENISFERMVRDRRPGHGRTNCGGGAWTSSAGAPSTPSSGASSSPTRSSSSARSTAS